MILDKSGLTFTKGYGETLEFEDSESYYNQKFGQKEFHELISSEHPDLQIIQKCKALILHEIGRIFGLIREVSYFSIIKHILYFSKLFRASIIS